MENKETCVLDYCFKNSATVCDLIDDIARSKLGLLGLD